MPRPVPPPLPGGPPPLPPPVPSAWQGREELATLPGIGGPPGGSEPPPSLNASLRGLRVWFGRNPWVWFVLGAGSGTGLVSRVIDALDLATRADVAAVRTECLDRLDGGSVDSVARDGGAVDSQARGALDGGAYDRDAREGIAAALEQARAARAEVLRAERLIGVDGGDK